MVERRFNKPLAKIGNIPIFWMQQMLTSTWSCAACHTQQPKRSLVFEITTRFARARIPGAAKDGVQKKYICLNCAENMLDETLDKVRLARKHGPQGFKLIEGLK